MYFIDIPKADLARALDAWQWVGIPNYSSYKVTAFGDVFFSTAKEEIFFLDTLEGAIDKVFTTFDEFNEAMQQVETLDHYCMAAFVDRARREGMHLASGQCYDWLISPVLGGQFKFENIHVTDFVVAVNIAGQLHKQIKELPPGTPIKGFKFIDS